ncbi:hypothetical protein FKM82_027183 [Ascaphus truei]
MFCAPIYVGIFQIHDYLIVCTRVFSSLMIIIVFAALIFLAAFLSFLNWCIFIVFVFLYSALDQRPQPPSSRPLTVTVIGPPMLVRGSPSPCTVSDPCGRGLGICALDSTYLALI